MRLFGIILIVTTTLFPAYQLAILPNISDSLALFSQYLGLAALILMAWAQIMATKFRLIETLFGSLDYVYILHKWTGIIALIAILLHDTIDADMEGFGPETWLSDIAETMGELSLYGILVLCVISIATFIPYHLWKWTHKFMGAMFILGAIHFIFILKPFSMTDAAGFYTFVFCLVGALAYLWNLLPEHLRPSHSYVITEITPTGDAIAITLRPKSRQIKANAGQFGIFRFVGAGNQEPHPFSFSKIGSHGELRLTVKSLGDYTTRLPNIIAIGQAVSVQGPFGHFCQPKARENIWIAGGIGITPFLSIAHTLTENADTVTLFYCVKSRAQAPHLSEIEQLSRDKPTLKLHIIASDEGQRLTAEKIATLTGENMQSVRVAFCGPKTLREALQTGLRRYGLRPSHFKYEAFEFRTGIGLDKLAIYLLTKMKNQYSSRTNTHQNNT